MKFKFYGKSFKKIEKDEIVYIHKFPKNIKIDKPFNTRLCKYISYENNFEGISEILKDNMECKIIEITEQYNVFEKKNEYNYLFELIDEINEKDLINIRKQKELKIIEIQQNKIKNDIKKTKNYIKKMIENNDKGLSGFWTDLWENDGCGNKNVLSEFNQNKDITLTHIACPYDKDFLLGTNHFNSTGCFHKCSKYLLQERPELRKKVLKRFLNNLENDKYMDLFLSSNKHKFKISSLLKDCEIEQINKEEKEKNIKINEILTNEKLKHEKTLQEKEKNLITFHANNLNPLPLNLYNSIIDLYTKNESIIDEKILTYEKHNNFWNLDKESNKIIYYDYFYDMKEEELYPFNTSISFSVYYDYQINKNLFYFCVENTGSNYCCILNDSLYEFYNKWKTFKNNNMDKYNIAYKITRYDELENYINFNNSLTCETCLYNQHCYGICLLPENKIVNISIPKKEQYKVNLHLLEPCNYKCKHCFAHFDNHNILPVNVWKHIVDNCSNAIFTHEFNIAGGEPLLYKDLDELILYIKYIGADVSIITNGFLMNETWIKKNAPLLSTIGFSIDSFIPETLLKMGRKTNKNEYLSKERFIELVHLIKKYNPKCKIKVNSVITSLNYTENLIDVLKPLNINRWKILKMKVFKNQEFDNSNISITDSEYNYFLESNLLKINKTNKNLEKEINNNLKFAVIEDTLKNTYIMIDANGNLVDNSNDNYKIIINAISENFLDGFEKLNLNKELYFARY